MLFHYLAASFRDLVRGGFYSMLSVFGLALGLCAALVVGLVIRNQLSYDQFIPGYERTYLTVSVLKPQGRAPDYNARTHNAVAALFKVQFPQLEAVTRLADQVVVLRKGQVESAETIYWADPNVFEVLPLPSYAGDLKTALRSPNSIVLTRSAALKYFGSDAPIGETIELDGKHVLTVAAVAEDLPPNATRLESGIFASGLAADSLLSTLDKDPDRALGGRGFGISVFTYARVADRNSIERVQEAMPELMNRIWPQRPPGLAASMEFVRLDKVHVFPGFDPTINGRLSMTALIGVLILFVACVNFVNLSTARSTRRAKEVGVRKAAGASRQALLFQFLGESSVHVALATIVAVLFTALALPYVNLFLNSGAVFDVRSNPVVLVWILAGVVTVALLTGAYPAFVLAGFRPVDAIKEGVVVPQSATLTRQLLVILQFAVLIGLLVATSVVYLQRAYATGAAVRVQTNGMLVMEASCEAPITTALRSLPGISAIACTDGAFLHGGRFANIALTDGTAVAIDVVSVQFEIFDTFALEPVNGEWPPTIEGTEGSVGGLPYVAINETAVRALGYESVNAAVGKSLTLPPSRREDSARNVTIAGVVKDFSLSSIEQGIKPTIYDVSEPAFTLIHVKLSRSNVQDALAAIDRSWKEVGTGEPIKRYFLAEHIENIYFSLLRETQAFSVFSGVAMLLACLGMVGLSASATERRIKEIGIRKTLGANTARIMRLLIWQFSKPVLLANLVAWPVAWLMMNRWLDGFAYHIELTGWLFALSSVTALVIAVLTVSVNCYLAARARPTIILRHE